MNYHEALFSADVVTPQSTIIDIFRPFIGFKEVRLVHKDAKRVSATPDQFCFKDHIQTCTHISYALFFLKKGSKIVVFITFSHLTYEMLFGTCILISSYHNFASILT